MRWIRTFLDRAQPASDRVTRLASKPKIPFPVESHMLSVCQEIVHTILETQEVKIGKGPLSMIAIRR